MHFHYINLYLKVKRICQISATKSFCLNYLTSKNSDKYAGKQKVEFFCLNNHLKPNIKEVVFSFVYNFIPIDLILLRLVI